MSRILRRKKRGPVRSKKKTVDGIEFKSGLEAYMYKALRDAGIKAQYEGIKFELIPSFDFKNKCYERQSNGKGEYKDRGSKKILRISYTPDFTGAGFIIECKGRANESFPIRWKLFKKYVRQTNLFLYVGNYLRNMSANDFIALLYINHKIKKNATKP